VNNWCDFILHFPSFIYLFFPERGNSEEDAWGGGFQFSNQKTAKTHDAIFTPSFIKSASLVLFTDSKVCLNILWVLLNVPIVTALQGALWNRLKLSDWNFSKLSWTVLPPELCQNQHFWRQLPRAHRHHHRAHRRHLQGLRHDRLQIRRGAGGSLYIYFLLRNTD